MTAAGKEDEAKGSNGKNRSGMVVKEAPEKGSGKLRHEIALH